MADIMIMQMADRVKNLFENPSCLILSKELIFHYFVEKLAPRAKLSDQVKIFGVFEILVQFEYIWVINFLQYLNFLLKLFLVFNLGQAYRFTRSDLLSYLVADSVYYSICSTSKNIFFVDLVALRNGQPIFEDHGMLFYNKTIFFIFGCFAFHFNIFNLRIEFIRNI